MTFIRKNLLLIILVVTIAIYLTGIIFLLVIDQKNNTSLFTFKKNKSIEDENLKFKNFSLGKKDHEDWVKSLDSKLIISIKEQYKLKKNYTDGPLELFLDLTSDIEYPDSCYNLAGEIKIAEDEILIFIRGVSHLRTICAFAISPVSVSTVLPRNSKKYKLLIKNEGNGNIDRYIIQVNNEIVSIEEERQTFTILKNKQFFLIPQDSIWAQIDYLEEQEQNIDLIKNNFIKGLEFLGAKQIMPKQGVTYTKHPWPTIRLKFGRNNSQVYDFVYFKYGEDFSKIVNFVNEYERNMSQADGKIVINIWSSNGDKR